MAELQRILGLVVLGNTIERWAIAVGIFVALLMVLMALRRLVRKRYRAMAATAEVELLELPLRIASRTTFLFLLVVSLGAGLSTLTLGERPERAMRTFVTVVFCLQIGIWISMAFVTWLERRRDRTLQVNRAAAGTFTVIAFIGRLLIWTLILLLTLDNLGINITALVAGLGIGGVAVALAVQSTLGDLLASLSITLDKPFVVGDALGVGDFSGTVESIGIKSTRLRSISGEQIIIANADLLSSRVRNWSRLAERRVAFTLTLSYEIDHATLKEIPGRIQEVVLRQQPIRFDRCHFTKYTATGLEFEIVYFVLSADYGVYMNIQQAINLDIFALFERSGVQFAYPVMGSRELAGTAPVAKPA